MPILVVLRIIAPVSSYVVYEYLLGLGSVAMLGVQAWTCVASVDKARLTAASRALILAAWGLGVFLASTVVWLRIYYPSPKFRTVVSFVWALSYVVLETLVFRAAVWDDDCFADRVLCRRRRCGSAVDASPDASASAELAGQTDKPAETEDTQPVEAVEISKEHPDQIPTGNDPQ